MSFTKFVRHCILQRYKHKLVLIIFPDNKFVKLCTINKQDHLNRILNSNDRVIYVFKVKLFLLKRFISNYVTVWCIKLSTIVHNRLLAYKNVFILYSFKTGKLDMKVLDIRMKYNLIIFFRAYTISSTKSFLQSGGPRVWWTKHFFKT